MTWEEMEVDIKNLEGLFIKQLIENTAGYCLMNPKDYSRYRSMRKAST